MDPITLDTLRAAEQAVRALVQACQKHRALYARDPKAVAQVSRTGKWHLNAVAHLRKVIEAPAENQAGHDLSRRGA